MKSPAKNAKKVALTTNKSDSEKALTQLVSYLEKRDHSRQELRQKLTRRFDPTITEQVLTLAGQRGWLEPELRIAERAVESWRRRRKSQAYIEAQLSKRGLPPVRPDPQKELENLRQLVDKRFGPLASLDSAEKQKAARYLSAQGFEEQLIRMVIYE